VSETRFAAAPAPEAGERRLLVVSHRLPLTVKSEHGRARVERSTGGLVGALDPALQRRGGTWLGWAGWAKGALPPRDRDSEPGYRIVGISLTRSEVRGYHHGFANRTLWPLFHCLPSRMEIVPADWQSYDAVNRRFAELAASSGAHDPVWVHDYHLMRVAAWLRPLRPDARIGFFLHVPFPPFDLFRILPWDRELLRGLLACDLVGFHCERYATNFLDCAEQLLGARVDREHGQVEHGERTVKVAAFPLGVDYDDFARRAREAPRAPKIGERVVLGVDRLDYTKGVPERIRAFERMLELHPEHRERIVLLQVAEPSRGAVAEYRQLKREVDELVGRVNGRFATSAWTPVRYLHRHVDRDTLAQLYRDADVALVTPLCDGMNLVAKEYVSCQVEGAGVLVLSRLAGAAETMREALQVNPYHVDGVAEALHESLVMDPGERLARMRSLQRRERESDVHAWLEGFLRQVVSPLARFRRLARADFAAWLERPPAGKRLALFLDADRILLARDPKPGVAEATVQALLACAAREDTEVTLVSGRPLADLRGRCSVPRLGYVASHGLEIEVPGLPPFHHPDLAHFAERLRALAARLAGLRRRGVRIEEKGTSLTLDYRGADPPVQRRIAERAREVVSGAGFQARATFGAVEARPPSGWDKGRAVFHVLRSRHGPDWPEQIGVVYVGDDETDEDAFRALSGLAATFRVGTADRPSSAARRLPDAETVETLLRWVAERPGAELRRSSS